MKKAMRELKGHSPDWAKGLADTATRRWGVATSAWRSGPDFLIAGTKRGGTTSLWNNLLRHPQILGLYPQIRGKKSTDFFFADGQYSAAWYRSHFPTHTYRAIRERVGGNVVAGEASPYYMYGPHCAALIAAEYPDVRIVVLLRDPVDRAYSHYQERVQQGGENLAFEEALDREELRLATDEQQWLEDPRYYSQAHDYFGYRSRGLYLPQLQRLHLHFPRQNVFVGIAEDFYRNYQDSYSAVTDFLGVRRFDLGLPEHHNRIRRPEMPSGARAELEEYFSEPNKELARYLGVELKWSGS